MTMLKAEAVLTSRLKELGQRIEDIDTEMQQALPADFAEQAGDLENQNSLSGIEKNALGEVKAISAALRRIKLGTYGICVDCGEKIPDKRLESVPTALRCMPCETKISTKA